ncbi:MAG: hypothetical protein IJN66_00760 [Muribaculaceae bacterium]|nr:hypothetical protein [Muribaculaceae bacterium]
MISARNLSIVLCLCPFLAYAGLKIPTTLGGALDLFDEVVKKKDLYVDNRYSLIDSIKAQETLSNRLIIYEKVGKEFCGVNVDSAIYYYNRGLNVAIMLRDSMMEQRFRLLKAAIMPVIGVVKESVEEYDVISAEYIYPENKELFFETGNRLNFYVTAFYPYSELKQKYLKNGVACNDSLLLMLRVDEPRYMLYAAQVAYVNRDIVEAVTLLDRLISEVPLDDNLFARASSMRASLSGELANSEEYLYYLSLSAISDIIAGIKEGTSLQMLGVALYECGDIDRAYLALTTALDNAVSSGARIRAMETSQSVPVISQTFRAKDQRKMLWLLVLTVCLIVAIVGIVLIAMYLHREKRKLEILRLRLMKSNYAKETYMSQFLSLCSLYMDKLDDFNRLVGRKIVAGQLEELHSLIKRGQVVEEQNKLFYEMFDDAFVHIYPTFVTEVNSLLHPDRQVELHNDVCLNMEMRILAFMRMGITDNAKIARFLGLSLNTIYAYRNKMRNRAVNRDEFEQNVLKIGRIG